MEDQHPVDVPRCASFASLALVLLAAVACLVAWMRTDGTPFLVASIGLVVVSPVWYWAPPDWRALSAPIGSRITYRRRFSAAQGMLSLVGYAIILVAMAMWFRQWLAGTS